MPTLSPEQQLAMAHEQLGHQQPAMPGIYNQPLTYVQQVERQATGLTSGAINLAAGAAGLGGTLAFSFGPLGNTFSPFGSGSLGAQGWNMGARMTGAKMVEGTLQGGRLAGKLAGGFGGAALSMLPFMAMASATDYAVGNMVEGQRDFLATRSVLRELRPQTMFGQQSILSPQMPSLTSNSQVMQMQTQLSQMGGQFGASPAQMRNAMGMLGQMGALDTSSVRSVSQSLRQSMRELQDIARQVNGDIEEATQVYASLRQMGFTTAGGRSRALRGMTSASGLTGMSLGGVQNFATQSMQTAQSLGINAQLGMNIGLTNLVTSSVRAGSGAVNPTLLAQYGGATGLAQRMTEIQLGAGQTMGGLAMISQGFSSEGQLNAENMFDAIHSRRLRVSRNFERNYDPYALPHMQEQFASMSGNMILSRVNAINARYADDPLRARREQFDFMQQMGMSDPREQLEFLSTMRAQPRMQALQSAQDLSNRVTLAQRPRESQSLQRMIQEQFDEIMRNTFGHMSETLQRQGANLQQTVERIADRITNRVMPETAQMATGRYTEQAIGHLRDQIMSGDFTSIQRNPLTSLRRRLDRDEDFRVALGSTRAITGRTEGPGGLFRRGGINALGVATGTSSGGTFVGLGANGAPSFATGSELIDMVASNFGASFDAATGSFVSANNEQVRQMLALGGAEAIDNMEQLAMERSSPTRRLFMGWGLGANSRQRAEMAQIERDIRRGGGSLDQMERLRELRGEVLGSGRRDRMVTFDQSQMRDIQGNRMGLLDEISRSTMGGGFGEIGAQDRANLIEMLRQSGGQVASILAGGEGNLDQASMVASVMDQAARGQLGIVLGGGDTGELLREQEIAGMTGTLGDFQELLPGLREGANEELVGSGVYDLQQELIDASRRNVRREGSGEILLEDQLQNRQFSSGEILEILRSGGTRGREVARALERNLGLRGSEQRREGALNAARGQLNESELSRRARELNANSLFGQVNGLEREGGLLDRSAEDATLRTLVEEQFMQNSSLMTGVLRGTGGGMSAEEAISAYAAGGEGANVLGSTESERLATVAATLMPTLQGQGTYGDRRGRVEQMLTDAGVTGDRLTAMTDSIMRTAGNIGSTFTQDQFSRLQELGGRMGEGGRQSFMGGLQLASQYAREAEDAAGFAVINQQSDMALGVLRRQGVNRVLESGVLGANVTLGGQSYSMMAIARMQREGSLTEEQLAELYSTAGERVITGDYQGDQRDMILSLSGPGGATGMQNLLGRLVSGGGESGTMVNQDVLAQFAGVSTFSQLEALAQVQRAGGGAEDAALLEEVFGQDLSALMQGFQGASDITSVQDFINVLESGSTDDRVRQIFQRVGLAGLLGEDMTDQSERSNRQALEISVLRRLDAALNTGVPVIVRGSEEGGMSSLPDESVDLP